MRKNDSVDSKDTMREIQSLKPILRFKESEISCKTSIATFSDASHGGTREEYGQSKNLSDLKVETNNMICYYPIFWTSNKQRLICYSSYGAKILSALDADHRGFYLKQFFNNYFPTLI